MTSTFSEFEAVIGLEVHVQLATESKIFCGCRSRLETGQTLADVRPNSRVCPVCSGQPGSLPVLNRKAVEFAIQAGLATECQIAERSVFARKNYFYPDLPKGYQISQFDEPLCLKGRIWIEGAHQTSRWVTIERIHMEEDAGKSVHSSDGTQINLNRAGTPLIEVVSAPEMHAPEEAGSYLRELYAIVTAIGVCDGNLQEGNFRCDANVSVRLRGSNQLGTRTEIKNVNSFRYVEKAIAYEIQRQVKLIREGGGVRQETRLYDPDRDATFVLRSKEDAPDYRYFPEPDLPVLQVSPQWREALRAKLPELPRQKRTRYQTHFGLSEYDTGVLTAEKELTEFFEAALLESTHLGLPLADAAKAVTNFLTQEIARRMKEQDGAPMSAHLKPAHLAELVKRTREGALSITGAKQVIGEIWLRGGEVEQVIQSKGLAQVSDIAALIPLVREVLNSCPVQVAEFKSGKEKVIGFLVGQIMKKSGGKANPGMIQQLIRNELGQQQEETKS